jgi:hypothetical protein
MAIQQLGDRLQEGAAVARLQRLSGTSDDGELRVR